MGTATVADIVHEILDAESLPIPSSSLLALIQTLVDHAEHLEQTVSDLNEQLDNLREQVTLGNAATVIQAGFRGAKDREIIMRAKKFQQQGTRVLKKYLLKKDRVPGLHKLDTLHGDIGSPKKTSVDGIKHILDIVAADGYSKVVWVTLRELNDNDLVPGMTGHNITVLESTLKNSLVDQLKSSDHRFEYWHEPTLLCNELAVTTVDPSHVLTLPELMSSIQHTRIRSITYYRAPIDRENFPEHSILDQLVEWIHNADATTAMIFNCQVILALCEKLEHGVRTKGWVDKVIDDASAIYNIRLVIDEYRTKSLEEAKPAKRSFFLVSVHHQRKVSDGGMQHRACRLLERYFYFIVFGSYLTTTPTDVPFSTWLQGHPDLFRLLDTMGGATYPSSKVLHNNILKFDHFPGLNRLPMVLGPNVPNFRQVGDFPIFGTAQHLRSIGHPKAIWINLREEVILYVAGRPFAVRNQDNVFLNAEYPGIEVNEITAIEATLKKELIEKVSRNNGLFKHLYVSDEIAPEEKDFDDLVRLLGPIFTSEVGSQHPTAIICNCQMGRGRTTTMLVCMYMLRAVIAGAVPSHVEPKSTVHFGVIDELVATLDNGQASLDLVNHAV
ncbi:hypothetical protein DYB32_006838, partial [Aphanomyces invadans]